MTAAAPPMSIFMVIMPSAGLERQATGVEGDALADEGQGAAGVGRLVGELDEPGLLERAPVHAEQAAEAPLGDLVPAEDGDREVLAVGDLDGDLGQRRRGQRAARRVHEVAGEVLGLGDPGALARPRPTTF